MHIVLNRLSVDLVPSEAEAKKKVIIPESESEICIGILKRPAEIKIVQVGRLGP